ncbi:MAG: hypothetical protein IIZ06_03615 [Kiritimatiellae bacterium]|nr:hypothetical protein [Kiritimatiellia bacterium]
MTVPSKEQIEKLQELLHGMTMANGIRVWPKDIVARVLREQARQLKIGSSPRVRNIMSIDGDRLADVFCAVADRMENMEDRKDGAQ